MLNDQYRRIFVAGCMEGFREALQGHTVGDACRMLQILGYGETMFWWVGANNRLYPWTASSVLKQGIRCNMQAGYMAPIEFIGGPDGQTMFKGSLLTLLHDRMLGRVLEEGISPIREIEHILWREKPDVICL
ncbi:MAG: hypothetical protein ACYS7Y_28345 [Planctomycetota bacterium]